MKNLLPEKDGIFVARAGKHINDAIIEAMQLSVNNSFRPIVIKHNDVLVTVHAGSNAELLCRDYFRALNGYIEKKVGPHPRPVLTEEEKANDARIEEANKRRRRELGFE